MKRVSATGAWRRARILGTVLAVAALCLVPATAKSSKAEKAVGGRTIMEQAADQLRLHTELAPRVPKGVTNEPVVVDIDQGDREALAAPYDPSREPMRIGVVKEISRMIGKRAGGHFTGGVLDESANGSFVWAASFQSHGAQAIRLRLQDFFLPSGAEMYLLGDNGQAHGPYTDRGRNGSGEFWTRAISGEKATLILTYGGPNAGADKPRISFVVSDVGSIHGRPPRPQERVGTWPCNDNVSCLVDAQCINSGPAVPAKDAVAKMEWIQGPYIYTCTGGLLADTDGSSQIPYFLSANHCLSNSNSSLETFFFYQTSSCEGSCPDSLVSGGNPPPASTVGVTVLSSGSAGDYTLMTLNEAPPAGVTYLAWNNAAVSGTSGTHLYRVSNANFGP